MRHATAPALERLAPLLDQLRTIGVLTERKQGTFYRGSRAFLHFHEDGQDLFADLKGAAQWDRHCVTSKAEQARLLAAVRRRLTVEQ